MVMMNKMLLRSSEFLQNQLYFDRPFKQLFITLSPTLASQIKDMYATHHLHLRDAKLKFGKVEEEIMSYRAFLLKLDSFLPKPILTPRKKLSARMITEIDLSLLSLADKSMIPKEMTFSKFARQIYPRLNRQVTTTFNPAFLFTEFISIIKGHESIILGDTGYLRLEEYTTLSDSRNSILTSEERETVYKAWRVYEKYKNENHELDIADITFMIYRQLLTNEPLLRNIMVDCLYVDEVSPFSCISG